MDASKFPGSSLLIKYVQGDITSDELTLLHKYIEVSPILKEKFEELSDPDNVRARFRAQFDFDTEALWVQFSKQHMANDANIEKVVTIGIAEDHELMRDALKFLLIKNNYKVIIEASNGNDLVMKIQNSLEKPMICFVDANMPVMNGCETVRVLKGKHPTIKIIAYSMEISRGREMISCGADAFLSKNSSNECIIECISKLLKYQADEKS